MGHGGRAAGGGGTSRVVSRSESAITGSSETPGQGPAGWPGPEYTAPGPCVGDSPWPHVPDMGMSVLKPFPSDTCSLGVFQDKSQDGHSRSPPCPALAQWCVGPRGH